MDKPVKARKKRDTSKMRQTILNGAIDVFSSYGFAASSMDRVAEAAGISKRTIYNHFASKEQLFEAIVALFVAQRDAIKPVQYVASLPLNEQLLRFMDAELYLVDDPVRRKLSRLLTNTFLLDAAFGRRVYGQYAPHQALIQWLEDAQKDGRLCVPFPALAARMFYGMVEGCLTWPALISDGASLQRAEGLREEIVAFFLRAYGVDDTPEAQ